MGFKAPINGRNGATTIASSTSYHSERADYQCPGTNDDITIQEVIDDIPEGSAVELWDGDFIFNPPTSMSFVTEGYTEWKAGVLIDKEVKILSNLGANIKFKDNMGFTPGVGAVAFAITHDESNNVPSNVLINGLGFDGNKANNANINLSLLFLHHAYYPEISDCYMKNGVYPIWGDSIISDDVETCQFYHIQRNKIDGGGAGAIALHNGVPHSIISDNIINAPTIGVFLDSTLDVTVSNNKIYKPSVNGILLFDTVLRCLVEGNTIYSKTGSPTSYAIDVYTDLATYPTKATSDYNIIRNNLIYDFPNGIRANGTSNRIYDNDLQTVTVPLTDSGTSTRIRNNNGYNQTNPLYGITPTFDGFDDVNPTDLANATNEDLTSVVGTGQKVMTGSGTCGQFYFDLGVVPKEPFDITTVVAMWVSAGTGNITMYVDQGASVGALGDNSSLAVIQTSTNDSNVIKPHSPISVSRRYFRLRFVSSAAQTANVSLKEVSGRTYGLKSI